MEIISDCIICVFLKTKNIILKPDSNVPLYLIEFPKKQTLYKQWVQAVCLQFPEASEKIDKQSKVCSLHFLAEAFENNDRRQKLKDMAVPEVTSTSVYNGQDEDILIYIGQNNAEETNPLDGLNIPLELSSNKSEIPANQCLLCNLLKSWKVVLNVDETVSYHSFPKDKVRSDMWLKRIADKFPNSKLEPTVPVCSLHFPKSAFVKGTSSAVLNFSAMPVVNSFEYYHKSKPAPKRLSRPLNDEIKIPDLPCKITVVRSKEKPTHNESADKPVKIKIEEPDVNLSIESSAKLLDCDICGKKFETKTGLAVHKAKIHNSLERRQLKHGELQFTELAQLHSVLRNEAEVQKCRVCTLKIEDEDEFLDHLRSHSKDAKVVENTSNRATVFNCLTCELEYSSKSQYDSHDKSHREFFQCQKCKMINIDMASANNHSAKCEGRPKKKSLQLAVPDSKECIESQESGVIQANEEENITRRVSKRKLTPSKFSPEKSPKTEKVTQTTGQKEKNLEPEPTEHDKPSKKKPIVSNEKATPKSPSSAVACGVCKKRYPTLIDLKYHLSQVHGIKPSTLSPNNKRILRGAKEINSKQETKEAASDAGGNTSFCGVCSRRIGSKRGLNKHICQPVANNKKSSKINKTVVRLPSKPTRTQTASDVQSPEKPSVTDLQSPKKKQLAPEDPSTGVDNVSVKTEPEDKDGYDSDVWPLEEVAQPKKMAVVVKHTCQYCEKDFETVNVLNSHLRTVHLLEIDDALQCDQCLYHTQNKQMFRMHVARYHNDGLLIHKCEACGGKFKHELLLKEHKRKWHRPGKPSLTKFNEHNYRKTPGLRCVSCQLKFINKKEYDKHHESHRGFYECPLCQKATVSKMQAKDHYYKCRLPVMQCDTCNYRTKLKNVMSKHQQVHCRTTFYPCEVCKKLFTSKAQRRIHMYLHTGEKPYKCDICHLCFADPSTQRKHKKTHKATNRTAHIRPYQRPVTTKTTTTTTTTVRRTAFVQKIKDDVTDDDEDRYVIDEDVDYETEKQSNNEPGSADEWVVQWLEDDIL